VDRCLAGVARHARRGSVVVLLSDLVDVPDGTLDRFAALSSLGRTLLAVRVLDPLEASFALEGPVLLRAAEGDVVVETDATTARDGYLAALEAIATRWNDRLTAVGGGLLRAVTSDDPVDVLREIVVTARGGSR